MQSSQNFIQKIKKLQKRKAVPQEKLCQTDHVVELLRPVNGLEGRFFDTDKCDQLHEMVENDKKIYN